MVEVRIYKDGDYVDGASGDFAVGYIAGNVFLLGESSAEEVSNALISATCGCDAGLELDGALCYDVAHLLIKAAIAAKCGDLSELMEFEDGFRHE